jgi:SAM-dependent methyltransferase
MNLITSISKCYNTASNVGKILIFVSILLLFIIFFKSINKTKEGMNTYSSDTFTFKEGNDVYDDFYVDIYDHLVYNQIKNDYEIGIILNNASPTEISTIADIGCGTGHQVASLTDKNVSVIGIDISPSMIKKAKQNNPSIADQFQVGDALNAFLFNHHSLTHITCLYFTVYYMQNKKQFFNNCAKWLMPGGHFIVHLVDKYKFDPILPPGNPLYIVSPQKYAKERITTTKITFHDFVYNSNFKLEDDNFAIFDEKFKFNDGKIRKQEQKLYMEDLPTIVSMVQDEGFIISAKIDMVKCAYENQYLYVFTKPN